MTPVRSPNDDAVGREIRAALSACHVRRRALAVAIFLFDGSLFLALVAVAAVAHPPAIRLLAGIAAGFETLRLASIAHDAGHSSYTGRRSWDKMIARLAFLPAMQPLGTWEIAHNVVHHSWTSIRGKDYVWIPRSKEDFDRLPLWRRCLERLYRTPWGHGVYYFGELWFLRVLLPAWRWSEIRRTSHRVDIVLTGLFGALWSAGVWRLSAAAGQSPVAALFCAQALPFLVWCELFGLTLYLQHTHPRARFFAGRKEWEFCFSQSASATHVEFPKAVRWLFHGVFEHSAHHLDTAIPFYELHGAQRKLDQILAGRNVVYRWTWREFLRCCRVCKLYDYRGHRWLDFKGNPSEK